MNRHVFRFDEGGIHRDELYELLKEFKARYEAANRFVWDCERDPNADEGQIDNEIIRMLDAERALELLDGVQYWPSGIARISEDRVELLYVLLEKTDPDET